jgi:hypothetical protein
MTGTAASAEPDNLLALADAEDTDIASTDSAVRSERLHGARDIV